jgi:hypothetical protein
MAFCLATGCTNDPTAVLPAGTGTVIGNGYGGNGGSGGGSGATGGGSSGGGESPPADAGSGSNTPPPGTSGDDANAPRPSPEGGTGSGGHYDAGGSGSGGFGVDGQVPVIDSGSHGTSGPLGSCGNPLCGTEGTDCGCQATDSNGNMVQLGCQAGGQCACFVNGNQATNAFDENGACNLQQGPVQDFLQYCTAVCN